MSFLAIFFMFTGKMAWCSGFPLMVGYWHHENGGGCCDGNSGVGSSASGNGGIWGRFIFEGDMLVGSVIVSVVDYIIVFLEFPFFVSVKASTSKVFFIKKIKKYPMVGEIDNKTVSYTVIRMLLLTFY